MSKAAAPSFADHYVGGLDDRPGLIALLEGEIGHRLVGDRGRHDDAAPDIDAHMRGRGALRHTDDLSLELIARAEPHDVLLRSPPASSSVPFTWGCIPPNLARSETIGKGRTMATFLSPRRCSLFGAMAALMVAL